MVYLEQRWLMATIIMEPLEIVLADKLAKALGFPTSLLQRLHLGCVQATRAVLGLDGYSAGHVQGQKRGSAPTVW